MSSMKFKNTLDGSNSKQIIIDYKVLSGSVGNKFPVKYKDISITIDNFWDDIENYFPIKFGSF